MGKLQSLLGELVDALGIGAAQDPSAEAPKLTQAEVINMKINDIRSVSHDLPLNHCWFDPFGSFV
jgi:hypothetical protein